MGRTLGGATVASIQGLIVFVICVIAGFRWGTDLLLIPVALLFLFLMAVLFTALGTAIASVMEDLQGFQLIMNFMVLPLFFFSNALFPISGLPTVLRIAVRINPVTYGIDGLRGALTNGFRFGIAEDLLVLSVLAAILLAIASYLFSRIQL